MTAIKEPSYEPNGIHIIPITGIHRPGETPNFDATGEVRWTRRDGVTFCLQVPLTSFELFADRKISNRGAAGATTKISLDPEWIANTADGGLVRLYATSSETTTKLTTGWSIQGGEASESIRRVEGSACYADVDLHRGNPLAFWHETPLSHRLFSPGWELRWQLHEDIEYIASGSTRKRIRCSQPIGGKCDRQLIAAFGEPDGPNGVWLTYHPDEPAPAFWYPQPCDDLRGLMSILLGKHIPFVWRDTPAAEDRLTRLYFGWFRGMDAKHPRFQLVPVFGTVESLTFGSDVAARLVAMDRRFTELKQLFNPEWVVSPFWAAADDFLDNQLAHACVVLERLKSAYFDHIRPTGQYRKSPSLMHSDQKKALLKGLRETLVEVATAENLTADATRIVAKRIDNLFQPTNSDRLLMVFEELGIVLTDMEHDAISKRNKCMHGTPTLADGRDTAECGEELRRFDVLRTLIGRAMLHLFGYDGPYIDYGARPGAGNFPIRNCSPPNLCDPIQLQTD